MLSCANSILSLLTARLLEKPFCGMVRRTYPIVRMAVWMVSFPKPWSHDSRSGIRAYRIRRWEGDWASSAARCGVQRAAFWPVLLFCGVSRWVRAWSTWRRVNLRTCVIVGWGISNYEAVQIAIRSSREVWVGVEGGSWKSGISGDGDREAIIRTVSVRELVMCSN